MGRRRILVVDDSGLVRQLAQMALDSIGGWDVCFAESGAEALVRADAERPEAILLDVVMPEMDGFAALAALRAKPTTAPIPVILVTAKDKPADRARAESLGAAGMIAKPFAVDDLARQVATILGWEPGTGSRA
ncbi:MAG: response regulator [Actinomycetota bacterium]|nr:response regulator [Actinomycetota bacterium]